MSSEPKITYVFYNLFENIEMWDKFQMDCLKTRQDQDFMNQYLEKEEKNKTFLIGFLPTKRVIRTSNAQDQEYGSNGYKLLLEIPVQL